MKRLNDFMRPERNPTPPEAEAIAEVHAVVADWAADRLPLPEVRHLTTGEQRFLATRFTPPNDPRVGPLMRCLDALIATERSDGRGDTVQTKHGYFQRQDLIDAQAMIERADGQETIVFPVAYRAGKAVYRNRSERHAARRGFAVTPPTSEPTEERSWWKK